MTPRSPLIAGAWKAQIHEVDQAWKVFCYLCTPTLFSNRSILTWRVANRFFAKLLSFLFDNMPWCYLVVASLFPYSCALLLLFVIHIYALEQLLVLSCPKPQRVQSMRKTSQSTCRFFFSLFDNPIHKNHIKY